VFTRVVELVFNHQPAFNTVETLVRDVRSAKDEKSALALVAECQQDELERLVKAKAKHGRMNPAPAHKLLGNARRINNLVGTGLENIHLSILSPGDQTKAIFVFEELITNAKRLLDEIHRIRGLSLAAE